MFAIKRSGTLNLLKINQIELVLIDLVGFSEQLTYEKSIIKQVILSFIFYILLKIPIFIKTIIHFKNSAELRTLLTSSKSGNFLSHKMIELAQKFYDLSVTSVTNIPMKVIEPKENVQFINFQYCIILYYKRKN